MGRRNSARAEGVPVALQSVAAARLTRRAFIGGAAAVPMAGASLALAADGPTSLKFDHIAGTTLLRVTEFVPIDADDIAAGAVVEKARLDIELRGLGPSAEVSLGVYDEDTRYDLNFSNVEYGGLTGRLSLSFKREGEATWWLGLGGDLFDKTSFQPVKLRAFGDRLDGQQTGADDDRRLVGKASRDTVDTGLMAVFDGHIRCGSDAEISIDKTLTWRVEPLRPDGLTSFDGAVILKSFRFFWGAPQPVEQATPAAGAEATLAVMGLADPLGALTISIGEPGGTLASLSTSEASFAAQSPGADGRRAEARLHAETWLATIESHGTVSLGGLPLRGTLSRQLEQPPLKPGKKPPPADQLTLLTRVSAGIFAPKDIKASAGAADTEPARLPFVLNSAIGPLTAVGPETLAEGVRAAKEGAPRPFELSASRLPGAGASSIVDINASLLLRAASPALDGAEMSRLSFADTAFSLLYASAADVRRPASFLWLGQPDSERGMPRARIDLTRATLEAARAKDLLSLTFRFADLALLIEARPVEEKPRKAEPGKAKPTKTKPGETKTGETKPVSSDATLRIIPLPEDCRVITRTTASEYRDNRPVLVVEFPPQHVLEEAIFQQDLPPPPSRDLLVKDGETLEGKTFTIESLSGHSFAWDPKRLVEQLAAYNLADRATIRQAWLTETKPAESADPPAPRDAVEEFAALFLAKTRELEQQGHPQHQVIVEDQRYYIGPFGLEPDSLAVTRMVLADRQQLGRKALVAAMFVEVGKQLARVVERRITDDNKTGEAVDLADAIAIERAIESAVPAYQLFRQFYRDAMVDAYVEHAKIANQEPPATLTPNDLEHFAEGNRKAAGNETTLGERHAAVEAAYINGLSGNDPTPEGVRGRLAKASRLAFRINCGPEPDLYGRPVRSGMDHIPYSLDGLTDWSAHELSVVRRSQRLFDPLASGLMPSAAGGRQANLNDTDMLAYQGFARGEFTTARQRLAAIGATLQNPPDALETAIDLPARVTLSTAQDAAWRTPSYFPEAVHWRPDRDEDAPAAGVRASGAPNAFQRPTLWSASIDPDAGDPGLRVVHSPDFRPEFLWSPDQLHDSALFFGAEKANLKLPGNGAPPKGPFAPWLLGREETSNPVPSSRDVFDRYKQLTGEVEDASPPPKPEPGDDWGTQTPADWASFCAAVDRKEHKYKGIRIPLLIDYLCRRERQKAKLGRAYFRTALDAYDRHELVLLSSAYGLPVLGRRDLNYGLMKGSDQFEPGDGYGLVDVRPGSAVYRPKALDLRELTLTAIGGTLRHDTHFVPPASAQHLHGGNLFDALSIERWQQWTVLGRDVFTEVVYKGFLFPLGNRASLVKLTERVFMRTPGGFVKAFLKQRMFIRCGKPEKAFPALRQPNGGRRFPVRKLTILTVKTPDIVDPNSIPLPAPSSSPAAAQASGRLVLSRAPGLAFWPRTELTPDADVRFEFEIEGRTTRLPLLFVDNTAAHDRGALSEIMAYYNGLASPDVVANQLNDDKTYKELPAIRANSHKRTVSLGGQSLRYCDERKSGDSSHETEAWTLRAEGRRLTAGVDADPATQDFSFDPILEGADQPPFYPVVETARLWLRQTERFTGRPATATVAQFDEHYVVNGFVPSPERPDEIKDNAAEVYLTLVRPVSMGLGSNGDRGGGVFRPQSDFVAISRTRGPLGGSKPDATDKPTDVVTVGQPVNRAQQYHAERPAAGGLAQADAALEKMRNIYKRYFDPDTKLLGLIKLHDLLKFMGLELPDKGMPLLKEAVDYGAAQIAKAEGAAADGRSFVQTEVIAPLLKVVTGLNRRWDELQRELAAKQPGTRPITLDQVFPELGGELKELERTLNVAAGTTATLAFAAALSEVYETGRRLLDVLDRIAANPTEAIEATLRDRLDQVTGEILAKVRQLEIELAKLQVNVEPFVTLLVVELIPGAPDDPLLELSGLFPLKPEGLSAAATSAVEAAWAKLTISVATARAFLSRVLSQLLASPPVALDPAIRTAFTDKLKPALDQALLDALSELQSLGDTPEARALQRLIVQQQEVLVETTKNASALASRLIADAEIVLQLIERLQALREGVAARNIQRTVQPALQIIETFVGPLSVPEKLGALKDKANLYLNQLLVSARTRLSAGNLCAVPPSGADLCGTLDKLVADLQKWRDDSDKLYADLTGNSDKLRDVLGNLRTAAAALQLLAKNASDQARADAMVVAAAQKALGTRTFDITIEADRQELRRILHTLADSKRALVRNLVGSGTKLLDGIKALIAQRTIATDTLAEGLIELAAGASLLNLMNIAPLGAHRNVVGKLLDLETTVSSSTAKALSSLFGNINQTLSLADDELDKPYHELTALLTSEPLLAPSVQVITDALSTALGGERDRFAKWQAAMARWPKREDGSEAPATFKALFSDNLVGPQSLSSMLDGAPAMTVALQRIEGELPLLAHRLREALTGVGTGLLAALLDAPAKFAVADETIGLATFYRAVRGARDGVLDTIQNSGVGLPELLSAQLVALLKAEIVRPAPPGVPLDATDDDQLAVDAATLTWLSQQPQSDALISAEVNRAWLVAFGRSWQNGTAAPLQIAEKVRQFGIDLLRGDWFKLIDVSAIRDEIERYLKSLVPLRATLAYSFGAPFTAGAKTATAGIFEPLPDTRLDISVSATVDFQRPENVAFNAKGFIGPFTINLIGDLIDAVSIKFQSATFRLGAGGKPKLDVVYDSFVIGKDLEYIQKLQSLFSPGDGSGFYLTPTFSPLGIEAGYGIALPIISFGNVSFSNISLNAAVVIPFDDNEARFRASLSRRDAPFTISVAPYGGSGFFAIEANAQGIVGFEASFEFGGAAAFQYGPLSGIGRLMLGTYIRQTKVNGRRSTTLTGTFYIGGSASIWIFSFGASLYVRLGLVDGNMTGIATFTFSFSIGFADYDYSVSVARTENKIGGGNQSSGGSTEAFLPERRRVAANGRIGIGSAIPTNRYGATITNATTCQCVSWGQYRHYFDETIKPVERDLFGVA